MDDSELTLIDAQAWLRRYKQGLETLNANVMADLFSANGTYSETPFGPSFAGRSAIRSYWLDVASLPRGLAYDYEIMSCDSGRLVFHWTMHVLAGDAGAQIDGMSIADFDGAMCCRRLTDWHHRRESVPPTGRH